MDILRHLEEGRCRLQISGELTIYSAAEAKPALLDALATCQELEIDLAAVSELDTAGVQLLMMVKREAANEGKTLRLVEHSLAVLEVFELFELAGWFGDPLVLAATVPGEGV